MRVLISLNPGGWVYATVLGQTLRNGILWTVCTPIDDPYKTVYTAHPDKIQVLSN